MKTGRIHAFTTTTTNTVGSTISRPVTFLIQQQPTKTPTSSLSKRNAVFPNVEFTDLLSLPDAATTAAATATRPLTNAITQQIASNPFLNSLLHEPSFWSVAVQLTIVSLLFFWETAIELLRESTPKALLPVIESMLGEIGGLGFIGLVLEIGVIQNKAFSHFLEETSLTYLGDGEILLETFDFLHSAFFLVGITYFLICGSLVSRVITNVSLVVSRYAELDQQDEAIQKEREQSCISSSYANDSWTNLKKKNKKLDTLLMLIRELKMGRLERVSQILVIQEAYMDEKLYLRECSASREEEEANENDELPERFRCIKEYMQQIYAKNLQQMVELTPLVWIPLLPSIALGNEVDLAHDVVNSASPNALDCVGYFYSTPFVLYPSWTFQIFSWIWGLYNFYKVTNMKQVVLKGAMDKLQRIEEDVNDIEREYTLPLTSLVASEISPTFGASAVTAKPTTPAFLRPLETVFASLTSSSNNNNKKTKKKKTRFDELFGTLGESGSDFMMQSIKYQIWQCVTTIVFFGTQILPRDVEALWNRWIFGLQHPDVDSSFPWSLPSFGDEIHVVPELVTYGIFCLIALLNIPVQLRTFVNYSIVKSVQGSVDFNNNGKEGQEQQQTLLGNDDDAATTTKLSEAIKEEESTKTTKRTVDDNKMIQQ